MEADEFPLAKTTVTIFKHDTVYSADSVEWCPHKPNTSFFVCGNYQLTEEKGAEDLEPSEKRLGRILLFSVDFFRGLELHQTIETAAILDQKWCPNQIDSVSILGVVNAKRSLEIYKLLNRNLELVTKFLVTDDNSETLILSLDWSSGKFNTQQPQIICSDSNGNIHLLQLANSELILQKTLHAHDFQAWICGFNYWDTNVFFSGGDDSVFLKFDHRCGDLPVAKNRLHEAGVTSLHSNKSREFIVASGSYDEYVRLWDVRTFKVPLSKLKMPGPLWRLKWDPFCQKFLLAACMLGGVHIIQANVLDTMMISDSCYEHKNIAYGADWSFLQPKDTDKFPHKGNVVFGSCSFYDHLLCVSAAVCDFNSDFHKDTCTTNK
ncbi:diphthine methyltransferase [Euwallacea similis]|uniref:diphthine methyltransferase n=1 Tax=Euwallacea similis TaxID=1736056 RepID=UPI00344EF26E